MERRSLQRMDAGIVTGLALAFAVVSGFFVLLSPSYHSLDGLWQDWKQEIIVTYFTSLLGGFVWGSINNDLVQDVLCFGRRVASRLRPLPLDTAMQRLFLLLAIGGGLLMLCVVIWFVFNERGSFVDNVVLFDSYDLRVAQAVFYFGLVATVAGICGSFYWNATFGRLVRWVRHGRSD
jgi:hypothetical protein